MNLLTVEHYDEQGNMVGTESSEVEVEIEPTDAERIATIEAKLAAVEALASKANATAQEVAQAVKNAKPPTA